jgi:hypothetical protein
VAGRSRASLPDRIHRRGAAVVVDRRPAHLHPTSSSDRSRSRSISVTRTGSLIGLLLGVGDDRGFAGCCADGSRSRVRARLRGHHGPAGDLLSRRRDDVTSPPPGRGSPRQVDAARPATHQSPVHHHEYNVNADAATASCLRARARPREHRAGDWLGPQPWRHPGWPGAWRAAGPGRADNVRPRGGEPAQPPQGRGRVSWVGASGVATESLTRPRPRKSTSLEGP